MTDLGSQKLNTEAGTVNPDTPLKDRVSGLTRGSDQ